MAKTGSATLNDLTPTHDEIAAHAYQIYLREGSVEGRDMDHWLRAEAELRSQRNGNGMTNQPEVSAQTPQAATNGRSAKPEPEPASAVLPNSVVPPAAPIAQVTRGTTPKRNGKREAAVAK